MVIKKSNGDDTDTDEEHEGFIVGGRRLLRPVKITGSIASKHDYMLSSVEF